MTVHTADTIIELAEQVRAWRGWDLLQVRVRRPTPPWDYSSVVRDLLTGRDMVLDMDSGDGKLLTSLADRYSRGIGVDVSRTRIHHARLALPLKLRMRVHFTRASSHAVPAPGRAFNIVLCRHAPLFLEEIDRVLAPGGMLVTQQVAEGDAMAVCSAFEEARGRPSQLPQELSLDRAAALLRERGYAAIDQRQYDIPLLLGDEASLLYWLQTAPLRLNFDAGRDAATVLKIIGRLGTPRGIVTNERRVLLVMQKPE
jgi:SAM-dependent methyltransferase